MTMRRGDLVEPDRNHRASVYVVGRSGSANDAETRLRADMRNDSWATLRWLVSGEARTADEPAPTFTRADPSALEDAFTTGNSRSGPPGHFPSFEDVVVGG